MFKNAQLFKNVNSVNAIFIFLYCSTYWKRSNSEKSPTAYILAMQERNDSSGRVKKKETLITLGDSYSKLKGNMKTDVV